MPKLMKKCLKSWKKFCPDWEIILWNEDNFDVNSILWTKQAYEAKKYAFVSDYLRLRAFSGFESLAEVQTGVIGSEAGHPVIRDWLAYYQDRAYIVDGKPFMAPNVAFITENMQARGLVMDDTSQMIDDVMVYPQTWFCPLSAISIERKTTHNTYALHYFTSTWRTDKAKKDFARAKRHQRWWYRSWEKLKILPQRVLRKMFGDKRIDRFKEKCEAGSVNENV